MKHIFFVITFASIYDRVLPLIEEKKDKGEIIIVATTDQIEIFFKNYTDFTVIRTKVHPDLITRKSKRKILKNVILSKLEYRKLFRNIKDSEIYFCNMGWAVVIYSYIRKLKKRNKVIFYGHSLDSEGYIKYPVEMGFRAFGMRLFAKWFLGLNTIVYNNRGVPFWHLDDNFFSDIEILDDYTGDKELLNDYVKKLDILKGKSVLILATDSIASGDIERAEFVDKMSKMKDILDRAVPKKYIVKPHPRLNKLHGKMAGSETIPSYIPVEFILRHNWKAVVGIQSWSLVQATRLTKAKTISLIDAIRFTDEGVRIMFRNWIDKESNNKIVFPKEVKEVEQMLRGI